MTPLGAFYLEALERSPVEFRVVVDTSLPAGQFGQTGNGKNETRNDEARVCGPGGWVRIRINLKNIDDENQRVDRITQYLVGVGSRTDPVLERRLTDWGVLAHEFFHALDYVDGFPPLDPEPESDDPRFASYPDRFGEYVETWVQSMSEQ